MGKLAAQLAVCLENEGYEASLETRKLYVVLPDEDAAKHRLVRIIDESGEDYLYPAKFFSSIELSPQLRRAVLQAA
jgi:hypothetical protein